MDWTSINNVAQILGMILVPVIGWVFHTVIKHGSKLIMLEEKINSSILGRLDSLENKVDGIETKIDNKMDKLEEVLNDTRVELAAGMSRDITTVLEAINKQ